MTTEEQLQWLIFFCYLFLATPTIAAMNVYTAKTFRANVKPSADKKKSTRLSCLNFSLVKGSTKTLFCTLCQLLLISVFYATTGQVNTLHKSCGHTYQTAALSGHSIVQTTGKKTF